MKVASIARLLLIGTAALTLSGCRTHLVNTVIHNDSSGSMHNVQLDYPSATFGVSEIAPGQSFHYRFSIHGSGTSRLTFTDPDGHTHVFSGFDLHEGQQGELAISLYQNGDNVWAAGLAPQNK